MLNVPTLWTVFVVNFLALSLVWAYVMHSYPKFETARYWTYAALAAAAGAGVSMLRGVVDSRLPLLAGGTVAAARLLFCRDGREAILRRAGVLARPGAAHRPDLRRSGLLPLRG